MKYTIEYRVIGIFDNEYFHLHALDSRLLSKKESSITSHNQPNTLYQWGHINQKYEKTRRVQVHDSNRTVYGNVGIGTLAKGSEIDGTFCNGGEAFIYKNQAYRIIKGNQAIPIKEDDSYWILQIVSFENTIKTNSIKSARSREDLLNQIIEFIGYKQNFVVSFLARFNFDNFYLRSNGIFPTDNVADKNLSVFYGLTAIGGHIIGDSNDRIDIETPGNDLASIELIIDSELEIEIIHNKVWFQ